jgi:hypothetical protein
MQYCNEMFPYGRYINHILKSGLGSVSVQSN